MNDPKVLQSDEIQEARMFYRRICDWLILFREELDSRDMPQPFKDAILLEYARSRFANAPASYPPEFFKAVAKQADALSRMAGEDDEDE